VRHARPSERRTMLAARTARIALTAARRSTTPRTTRSTRRTTPRAAARARAASSTPRRGPHPRRHNYKRTRACLSRGELRSRIRPAGAVRSGRGRGRGPAAEGRRRGRRRGPGGGGGGSGGGNVVTGQVERGTEPAGDGTAPRQLPTRISAGGCEGVRAAGGGEPAGFTRRPRHRAADE
jgi:hypothetical protein